MEIRAIMLKIVSLKPTQHCSAEISIIKCKGFLSQYIEGDCSTYLNLLCQGDSSNKMLIDFFMCQLQPTIQLDHVMKFNCNDMNIMHAF